MKGQRKFARLRGELSARGITREELAHLLKHSSRGYVDLRFAGTCSWSLDEMYFLMDYLGWPVEKMHELFPRDGYDNPDAAKTAAAPGDSKVDVPCPECKNLNTITLVGVSASDRQNTEVACPWCGANIGNIITSRSILVSKAKQSETQQMNAVSERMPKPKKLSSCSSGA
jgi:predicted RNA-binding Zn-ribbon protein involved in translation (DUF1610 family)